MSDIQKLENSKFVDKIITIRDSKDKIIEVNIYYCVFNGGSISNNVKRKQGEIENTYSKIVKSYFNYGNACFNFSFIDCKKLIEQKRKNEEPLKGVKIIIPSFLNLKYRTAAIPQMRAKSPPRECVKASAIQKNKNIKQ